jgi:hypothetical protein
MIEPWILSATFSGSGAGCFLFALGSGKSGDDEGDGSKEAPFHSYQGVRGWIKAHPAGPFPVNLIFHDANNEEGGAREGGSRARIEGGGGDAIDDAWQAMRWMRSSTQVGDLMIEHVLLQAGMQHLSELNKMKSLSPEAIAAGMIAAVPAAAAEMYHGVVALNEVEEADPVQLNGKFAADADSFSFVYGGIDIYHGGLEGYIGNPSPNIMEALEQEHANSQYANLLFQCWGVFLSEHRTTARVEWMYVAEGRAKEGG